MKELLKFLSNIKTRSLLVFLGSLILIILFLIFVVFKPSNENVLAEGVKTKRISSDIQSLPGAGTADVIYNPLQEQANVEKAETALVSGDSAVATLLNPAPEGYGRGGFGDLNDGTGRCDESCYDETGYDAQGFDRDGYNKNGFDKNGFDKNGFDKNGFDKNGFDKDGFDKDGFDRNGFDKNGFDRDGFDKQGYDKDGFDRNGCNRQGLTRDGKPCRKFGVDCYDSSGLDFNGCNRDGIGPNGLACYDPEGFNAKGLDKCGYDRAGLNENRLDKNGCNAQGLDKSGKACYNAAGLNAKGLDKFGYDKDGFNKDGFDKNGFDKDGFDKNGYDKDGFDENGCNEKGLNRAGRPCYDTTGYTEEGFDRQGYDKNGYDKDGFDRQGYDKDGYDKDGFNRMGCNRDGLDRDGKPCIPSTGDLLSDLSGLSGSQSGLAPLGGNGSLDKSKAALGDYARLAEEQNRVLQQQLSEDEAERRAEALAAEQERMAAYESLMSAQAQAILQAWAPPMQTYVVGTKTDEVTVQPEKPRAPGELPPAGEGPIIGKAGDIIFAVVETSVNSDQPGPVLAKIVSGPLSGSRVMGSFERERDKVFIRFNILSMPTAPQSIAVDAVAVDPDTALPGLATDVDYHILRKYGTLVAASFLQGMGEAVETSIGTPELTGDNGAIIASQVAASTQDQVIVGLGKAGQKIADEIDESDIQPTVTVDSGTAVGLLLMSDLRVEEPAEGTVLRAAAPLAPGAAPTDKNTNDNQKSKGSPKPASNVLRRQGTLVDGMEGSLLDSEPFL